MVDSQWIVHQVVPSLGNQVKEVLIYLNFCPKTMQNHQIVSSLPHHVSRVPQGKAENGKAPWEGASDKLHIVNMLFCSFHREHMILGFGLRSCLHVENFNLSM